MNAAFQPDHSRVENYLIAVGQKNVADAGSKGQRVGAAPGSARGGSAASENTQPNRDEFG